MVNTRRSYKRILVLSSAKPAFSLFRFCLQESVGPHKPKTGSFLLVNSNPRRIEHGPTGSPVFGLYRHTEFVYQNFFFHCNSLLDLGTSLEVRYARLRKEDFTKLTPSDLQSKPGVRQQEGRRPDMRSHKSRFFLWVG